MNSSEVLTAAFERISEVAHAVLADLPEDALSTRVGPDANSIAWLIWHLTRVQDDHLAKAFGAPQVWISDGWAERFDLPFDRSAIGYGQSSEEVAAVRADPELLGGYLDATMTRTAQHITEVSDADLERVVDTHWDPPVTLGVRLISVIADGLQHAGQAAYVRGLLDARMGRTG